MKKVNSTKISTLISELENKVNFRYIGDSEISIEYVSSLDESTEECLTWVSIKKASELSINDVKAAVLVVPDSIEKHVEVLKGNLIITNNPRLAFALLANSLLKSEVHGGIHNSAVVNKEAIISTNVTIGPGAVIGKCTIGNNVRIGANCYIHDSSIVGDNVVIGPCSVIGGPGFGYEKDQLGDWILFPHIGGVIIGNNVDIGANTCIDRGALGNTVLKDGCKVDNLVHIAHNVVIGENALVIAHAMVAGSVNVGKNSWVAPGALIKNGLQLGENSIIGLGAVVVKNVPDNETWIGNPAKALIKK